MRIKYKILLSIGLSLLVSAAVLLIDLSILRNIREETARSRLYGTIESKVGALNLSIARFPGQPLPGRIRQIREIQRSIENDLEALTSSDVREESLIRQITANSRELGYSLEKLISNPVEPSAMYAKRYNVLVSQIGMKTQFISDDAKHLLAISQSRIDAAQKDAIIFTLGLIVALVISNAAISFFFGRSIMRRQETLSEALAKAEAGDRMLAALMANIPEGITICDSAGNILMVSRHGQDLLGAPHAGKNIEEVAVEKTIYLPDGRTILPMEEIPLARALKGEVVKDMELVQVGLSGRKIPLLCNAAPVRNATGAIVGGVVAWRDISDHKRAEESLRASEERFRSVMENMSEGLMLFDEQRSDLPESRVSADF